MTISYNEFTAYYENNPDLDNTEYYERFPDTNKSTIRSWKSRAAKPIEPEITEEEVDQSTGYEELEKEHIKLLIQQTGSDHKEFDGVDTKSIMTILKNRIAAQALNNKNKDRPMNSTILGNPRPPGQNKKKYGIDEYMVFDTDKDEIRMKIPMDVLLDPKKNRALGELQ